MNNILDTVEKVRYKNYFNANIGLFISVYNRPDYFNQVIDSMNKCEELKHVPIFIYQDNGKKSTINENLEISKKLIHKNVFFITRPKNYGCERNISYGLIDMFDVYKFDKLFVIEDDLVVSKNYFKYIYDSFYNIKEKDKDIGLFIGWNKTIMSPDMKKKYLDDFCKDSGENLWGFFIEKQTFEKIKIYLDMYLNIFEKQPYDTESNSFRDNYLKEEIKSLYKFMYEKSKFKNSIPNFIVERYIHNDSPSLSQDTILDFAFYCEGVGLYFPKVNRSICIGKTGQHQYAELWETANFSKVSLDEEIF